MTDYDYVFKIILIGDPNVGKTTLLRRFTDGHVDSTNLAPTIGVEYVPKTMCLSDGTWVKLAVWDTAGQERYRSIIRSYFRDVTGIVVVYDLCRPETLTNVKHWIELAKTEASDSAVITVVGNKRDLADNYNSDGERDRHRISALKQPQEEINEIFHHLAERIYGKIQRGELKLEMTKKTTTIRLGKTEIPKIPKKKYYCC
jgi:small GTP-binding protein